MVVFFSLLRQPLRPKKGQMLYPSWSFVHLQIQHHLPITNQPSYQFFVWIPWGKCKWPSGGRSHEVYLRCENWKFPRMFSSMASCGALLAKGGNWAWSILDWVIFCENKRNPFSVKDDKNLPRDLLCYFFFCAISFPSFGSFRPGHAVKGRRFFCIRKNGSFVRVIFWKWPRYSFRKLGKLVKIHTSTPF